MLVNHTYVLDIEKNFDFKSQAIWVQQHHFLAICTIVTYLVVIFSLQNYMKTREAFDLRKYLAIWNTSLAIFSFCGVMRIYPYVSIYLRNYGFHHSLCNRSSFPNVEIFWTWLFVVSKFVELGDTIFIVLRKQKLIFLHWFHHISALFVSWIGFADLSPAGVWVASFNYQVHVLMYSYYAIRVLRIKIPKKVAMLVTTLQILQFMVAVYGSSYIFIRRLRGLPCTISDEVIRCGGSAAFCYLFLFSKFFYDTYILKNVNGKQKTT